MRREQRYRFLVEIKRPGERDIACERRRHNWIQKRNEIDRGMPGQVKINAKLPPRLKASNSRGGKSAYINTNDVCSSIATAVALTELSEWAHLYTAVVYRHTTDTV